MPVLLPPGRSLVFVKLCVFASLGWTRAAAPLTCGHLQREQNFKYKAMSFTDTPSQNIVQHFGDTSSFIRTARAGGGTVFLHCMEGKSRSAACAIAFLIDSEGMALQEALILVKSARPIVQPNEGFLIQLQHYERVARGRQGSGSLRMAKAQTQGLRSASPAPMPVSQPLAVRHQGQHFEGGLHAAGQMQSYGLHTGSSIPIQHVQLWPGKGARSHQTATFESNGSNIGAQNVIYEALSSTPLEEFYPVESTSGFSTPPLYDLPDVDAAGYSTISTVDAQLSSYYGRQKPLQEMNANVLMASLQPSSYYGQHKQPVLQDFGDPLHVASGGGNTIYGSNGGKFLPMQSPHLSPQLGPMQEEPSMYYSSNGYNVANGSHAKTAATGFSNRQPSGSLSSQLPKPVAMTYRPRSTTDQVALESQTHEQRQKQKEQQKKQQEYFKQLLYPERPTNQCGQPHTLEERKGPADEMVSQPQGVCESLCGTFGRLLYTT